MKKFFSLIALCLLFTSATFSNIDGIASAILAAFKKTFPEAKAVEWVKTKEHARAKFVLNGHVTYAYYDIRGERIAVSRCLDKSELPVMLTKGLERYMDKYYLADLFEVTTKDDVTYYALLDNDKWRLTVQATAAGPWHFFRKQKR